MIFFKLSDIKRQRREHEIEVIQLLRSIERELKFSKNERPYGHK